MSIYDELGIKTIVNASDTYTYIGGSRMSRHVISAMTDAAEHFVNLRELAERVCERISVMTQNEAAFISSGCGACIVLTSAALMTKGDPELAKMLPDTSKCEKNEFVVFKAQTEIESLPYWKLIPLSGAKLVLADPTIAGLKAAVGKNCAGICFFAGDLYEQGLPPVGEVIEAAHEMNVRIFIDAAAQLPPVSNLWHYTKELGADGAVFSGGKFIMGPQSTGLFVGASDIVERCYDISSPNVGIGRPYKVGKEEYAALYAAIKQLAESNPDEVRARQNKYLDVIEDGLKDCDGIHITRTSEGRLGQDAPRLLIRLPDRRTRKSCADFLYHECTPSIHIDGSDSDDPSEIQNEIFLNSINLQEDDIKYIIIGLKRYLTS